jgi:MICOS complex subunit MIC60
MLEYAEGQKWDTLTLSDIVEKTSDVTVGAYRYAQEKISGVSAPTKSTLETAKEKAEKAAHEAKDSAAKVVKDTKAKVQSVTESIKTDVKKAGDSIPADTKHQAQQFTDEVVNLAKKAEDAIAGVLPAEITSAITRATPEDSPEPTGAGVVVDENVYSAPLPVGFEPPPGYVRPSPPKKAAAPSPPTPQLPRVLPDITALAGSEPIVTHLAEIIDNLSSYLHSHPEASSKITPVLEGAKLDLSNLVTRVEQVKEDERNTLEAKMDEQTREYNTKILEIEMEAQDRLDNQEEDFRKFHDGQKQAILHAYTDKLNSELQTQADIINQR